MNISKSFVVCLLFLLTASCGEELLREEVFTFQSPQDFYSNPNEVRAAANGMYDALMTWSLWVQPAWVSMCVENDDMLADDWVGGGYQGIQNGTWYIERPWSGFYQVINRANTVISRVGETDFLTDDQKNAALGQAYFMRGYCYYEIARRFGDAPIRTANYDPANDSPDIERRPREEVYLRAAEDFATAGEILPADYSSGDYTAADQGRPTAPAAFGMQAKVFMHLAGAEIGKSEFYADAITAATRVRDFAASGFPALESDYMTVFEQATQDGSPEILFSIQATQAPNEGPELPRFYIPGNTGFAGGGGIGAISLREDFYRTFEREDLRVEFGTALFDQWTDLEDEQFYQFRNLPQNVVEIVSEDVFDNGFGRFGNNRYELSDGSIVRGTPRIYTRKYVDPTSQVKDENGSNPIVLRYADVLLLLAEAENEVNGPTDLAYEAVNTIRDRAGLEDVPASLDQATFRTRVRTERRHELYAEFQRRWDLIRWGTWLETMAAANRPRLPYQLLFPIASEEIAANALINENNPGW